MIKNNFRILKKTHANLQTIAKAPVKFQKDWPKTVGGVEGTRYLLKIRNHAPRTTESRKQCPSAFLRKSGGQKNTHKKSNDYFIPKRNKHYARYMLIKIRQEIMKLPLHTHCVCGKRRINVILETIATSEYLNT